MKMEADIKGVAVLGDPRKKTGVQGRGTRPLGGKGGRSGAFSA